MCIIFLPYMLSLPTSLLYNTYITTNGTIYTHPMNSLNKQGIMFVTYQKLHIKLVSSFT